MSWVSPDKVVWVQGLIIGFYLMLCTVEGRRGGVWIFHPQRSELCMISPWRAYPHFVLSLDIFGHCLELYLTSKPNRGAFFLFIYSFFSRFIIHLFLLQPLADMRAKMMCWNWPGLFWSWGGASAGVPLGSGLTGLLALERRCYYRKQA